VTPLDVLAPVVMSMTSVAFLVYTFFIVTDPATTPAAPRHQVLFGFSVAAVQGFMMALDVAFGMFFALTLVSTARGIAAVVAERAHGRPDTTAAIPLRVVVNADGRHSRTQDVTPLRGGSNSARAVADGAGRAARVPTHSAPMAETRRLYLARSFPSGKHIGDRDSGHHGR
jgi:hypothetical protein